MVTVTAGGGFGKTCGVYTFLRNFRAITTWVQISERDNAEDRFWEKFTRGVFLYNPGLGGRLREGGFPGTREQLRQTMIRLEETCCPGNRRQGFLRTKYIFVWDDFYLLRNEGILRFIEHLTGTSIPGLCSILISRKDPAFSAPPPLPLFRPVRITGEELRFTGEEIDGYLRLRNITVSAKTVQDIYQDTEGWPLAVHLAARALKDSPVGPGYIHSSIRGNIFRFIEAEFWEPLPGDLQKCLIKLSLIDRWPPDLLREFCGNPELIKGIREISSLISYDPCLNTFKIHPLLIKFLGEKQECLTKEETHDVYSKTAGWCLMNNKKMDALGYYEKAGDYWGIIDLIYTLPQILPQNAASFLQELPERLPDYMPEEGAITFLRDALHPRALAILERFDEAAAESRAIIARYEAQPPSPLGNMILCCAYNILGFITLLTCVHTGSRDFETFFKRANDYYTRSPVKLTGPAASANMGPYICRVGCAAQEGDIRGFINVLSRAIPWLADSLSGSFYGMEDLAWTEYAFFQGDLPQADKHARGAIRKARTKSQYEIENRAFFYLIRISLARGDPERLPRILRLLEEGLGNGEFANRYVLYDIMLGWFYAHIGQPGRLAPWLKNDFDESALHSLTRGLDILVKAKYFFAENRYPLVLASLENQENRQGLGAFLFGELEMKVLKAVCLYREKRKDDASRTLKAAYSLAGGFTMPFIELGKDMRALTRAILKDGDSGIPRGWLENIFRKSSTYAKKLFIAAGKYREGGAKKKPVDMALSPRERDVLIGLSRGLTREEIARENDISINTVKSAARRIYYKLGAVNRADAIRIANARGFLKKEEKF